MALFGTLAPWQGVWYASIRKRIPNGVQVVDGAIFKAEESARAWLIERLEPQIRLLREDSVT